MTQLEAVPNDKLQHETVYCDGSLGRRRRVPTLLRPCKGRSGKPFKYAVWLQDIQGALVVPRDSQGRVTRYVPTNKTGLRG